MYHCHFLRVWVFCVPACLCTTSVACSGGGQKEGGVPDSCDLSGGCWELNLGFLKAQPVLLPIEPSLQPLELVF